MPLGDHLLRGQALYDHRRLHEGSRETHGSCIECYGPRLPRLRHACAWGLGGDRALRAADSKAERLETRWQGGPRAISPGGYEPPSGGDGRPPGCANSAYVVECSRRTSELPP